MALDADESPPWVVRFGKPGSPALGGGVYVGDGIVLTAAHVLRDVLGRPPVVGDEVNIRFARAGDLAPRSAVVHVVDDREITDAVDDGDRAVLSVADVPALAVPAPLRRPAATDGHRFRAFGFPQIASGMWASGVVRGTRGVNARLVQIEGTTAQGDAIRGGYSGCPVWDDDVQAVVGTVVSYDSQQPEKRIAAMVAIAEWERTWPALTGWVRWRLDQDPERDSHWLRLARGGGDVPFDADLGGSGAGAPAGARRGVDVFTGRRQVLRDLAEWLAPLADVSAGGGVPSGGMPDPLGVDRRAVRVIVGRPGSGKSAVLARLVWLADPVLGPRRDNAAIPGGDASYPDDVVALAERLRGAIDVAINVEDRTVEQVVAAISAAAELVAASPKELVEHISFRDRGFTIAVDGLEHAAPGHVSQIVRLLRALAGVGGGGRVRVLAVVRSGSEDSGTRQPLIGPLPEPCVGVAARPVASVPSAPAGTLGPVLAYRLDHEYLDDTDLRDYTLRRLRAAPEPAGPAYRAGRGAVTDVAGAVARKADGLFLIAQLLCDALALTEPVDVGVAGWEDRLPRTIDGAVEEYLDSYSQRFDPAHAADRATALRDVLTAFAYGRGDGLGADELCARVASALGEGGRVYDVADVHSAMHGAASYLIGQAPVVRVPLGASLDQGHGAVQGAVRYQLFHREVVDYLRGRLTIRKINPVSEIEAERRITNVLADLVDRTADGARPDWSRGDPYTLRHLAEHAEAGHVLGRYVDDVSFLAAADPEVLAAALYRRPRLGELEQVYLSAFHRTRDVPDPATAGPPGGPPPGPPGAAGRSTRPALVPQADPRSGRVHRRLRTTSAAGRAAHLELIARAYGAPGAAARFAAVRGWPALASRWARLRVQGPHLALAEHEGAVRDAVVLTTPSGRLAVATASDDRSARLWDLASGDLLHTLKGHGGQVQTIASARTHSGALLVTGSTDQTVRVWDSGTGEALHEFTGHADEVAQVAVASVRGEPVAVSVARSDTTVRVWNLRTGELRHELVGHGDLASSVSTWTLPDVPIAITAGDEDGRVFVWDLARGSRMATLTGHGGPVGSAKVLLLADNLDGTGDHDGFADPGDRDGRGSPDGLAGHDGGDGGGDGTNDDAVRRRRPVAVTGGTDGTVRVWSLPDGAPIWTLSGPKNWIGGHVELAVGDVDGRPWVIAGGTDGTIVAWDPTDGTRLLELRGEGRGWLGVAALSSVGGRTVLAVGGEDDAVRMWRLRPPRVLPALTGHDGGVRVAIVAQYDDRPFAVTAGADRVVRLWHLGMDAPLRAPTSHGEVLAVAVAPMAVGGADGAAGTGGAGRPVVVTGGADATVRIWDLDSGAPRPTPRGAVDLVLGGQHGPVRAVAVARLGTRRIVLSAADDGDVLGWDIESGERVVTLSGPRESDFKSDVLVVERAGGPVAVVAGDAGVARAWDLSSQAPVGSFTGGGLTADGTGQVSAVCPVRGRPDQLAVGGKDGTVWLWNLDEDRGDRNPAAYRDPSDGEPLGHVAAGWVVALPDPGHGGGPRLRSVTALAAASVDGATVAVAGDVAGAVCLWGPQAVNELTDDQASRFVGSVGSAPIAGYAFAAPRRARVRAVALAAERGLAVTVGADHRVVLWRLHDAEIVKVFTGHESSIAAVAVIEVGDQTIAVTGDDDGMVCAWDLHDLRLLATTVLTGPVHRMVPVPDGVVVATGTGHVRLALEPR